MNKYWYASIGVMVKGYKSFERLYGIVLKEEHPFMYIRRINKEHVDEIEKTYILPQETVISFNEITKEEFDLFWGKDEV